MLKTDHIVFPVWDAKASLAFYRDVMGFVLVDTYSGADWGGYPWLMMFFAAGDGREIVPVNLRGARRPVFQPSFRICGLDMNSMKLKAPSGCWAFLGTTKS